jgi:hypothetical protein
VAVNLLAQACGGKNPWTDPHLFQLLSTLRNMKMVENPAKLPFPPKLD